MGCTPAARSAKGAIVDGFGFRRRPARGSRPPGFGPTHHRGFSADGALSRAADAARELSDAQPDRDARDRLLDPLQLAAPEVRDALADRLRLPDPRPCPLPRERLLPALGRGRRLPSDPL